MKVKIGSRGSTLALWQANYFKEQLKILGIQSELIIISSKGDQHQLTSVNEIGGSGIFTRALDHALLEKEIDVAVHSFKDLPTAIHDDLTISCVLQRGEVWDVLVKRDSRDVDLSLESATIATGSPRRMAFWLNRHPHHQVVGIRGNVDSRLRKLENSDWYGTILAQAGISRLGIEGLQISILDWMIPAPAQGAMAVVTGNWQGELSAHLSKIDHPVTALCTRIEREFLAGIEGDCLAPIAAYAHLENNSIFLDTAVLNQDGSERLDVSLHEVYGKADDLGLRAAEVANNRGAQQLIKRMS